MNYIASSVTKYTRMNVFSMKCRRNRLNIFSLYSLEKIFSNENKQSRKSRFRSQNRPTHSYTYICWMVHCFWEAEKDPQQQPKRVISALCNMNCNDRFFVHTRTRTHTYTCLNLSFRLFLIFHAVVIVMSPSLIESQTQKNPDRRSQAVN